MGNAQHPVHSKKRTVHAKKRGGALEGEEEFSADADIAPPVHMKVPPSMKPRAVKAPQRLQDIEISQGPQDMQGPAMQGPAMQGPAMQGPATQGQNGNCPPCPPCLADGEKKEEESFFSKLNPQKLNDKLVAAQTSAIEGTKTSISNAVSNKKAQFADAITGFLKPKEPVQVGGRRSTKRKRSSTKRKRSSKKRSPKRR
jgi:hypothetical protein